MKKAAAYARVSSNSKAQEHSYEFQSNYWNSTLKNNPEYEYVGLFADKGISGKFMSRRPQFLALMDACKSGDVEIVFTKSVQRFARNTEELLTMVRELREHGVAVIFEKENINTLNPDSEMYLTIAAAIAEDDLNRYSESVQWSLQDRFRRGEPHLGCRLYGYVVTRCKFLTVNPEEAKVVKEIYNLYATGAWSTLKIRDYLNEKGVPAPNGEIWHDTVIRGILKNEKYYGACLIQKGFTENGQSKVNHGERTMYFVEENHEPIVTKELWDKVQSMRCRRGNSKLYGGKEVIYPFTGMIFCPNCNRPFIHKMNNSGRYYANGYWKCYNSLKKGTSVCNNTAIKDSIIEEKFVEAYNEFVQNGCTGDEDGKLNNELKKLYETERELMQLFANGLISRKDYDKEHSELLSDIKVREIKLQEIRVHAFEEKSFKPITVFDEEKLHRFIKCITVHNFKVTFEFYNGVKISKSYINGKQDWKILGRKFYG